MPELSRKVEKCIIYLGNDEQIVGLEVWGNIRQNLSKYRFMRRRQIREDSS